MRICAIASGSSGNCVYVGSGNTHILIDAGVAGKRIEQGLESIGVEPGSLSALLITHEHSDHISGVGVMQRKYHMPIYTTPETYCAMKKGKTSVGKLNDDIFHAVVFCESFMIGEIKVTPFSISHDAANPVAYVFEAGGQKIGMATDLGIYTEDTIKMLSDSDVLYLEANHDKNMLMVGSYPFYLKQRIVGDHGHLSNEQSAALLCEVYSKRLKHVILAHLSKENNFPELAYEAVKADLTAFLKNETIPGLCVAKRDEPSDMIEI